MKSTIDNTEVGIPATNRNSNRHRSIGTRLAIIAFAVSVVLAAVLSAVQIYFSYQSGLSFVTTRFAQIEQGYLPSLQSAMWEVNTAGIDKLLDAIAQLPNIGRITLTDENNFVFSRNEQSDAQFAQRDFVLHHTEGDSKIEIGRLHVELVLGAFLPQIKAHAIRTTATVLLILVGNVFLVLLLFRRTISRHLTKMAQFAADFDTAKLDTTLTLDRLGNKQKDELDLVVESLNHMQQIIKHELSNREKIELELLAHKEDLERLVEERTLAYKASVEQLQIATEIAKLGVFTRTVGSGYTVWNERLYEIFEIPEALRDDQTSLQQWQKFIHPEDAEATITSLIDALDSGNTWDTTYRIITAAGHIRHLHGRAQIIADAEGNPSRISGTNRDITEQVELQTNLTRALATTRAILNTARNPIITITATGIIRTINPAGEHDFGFTAAELIGQSIKLLIPESLQIADEDFNSHVFRKGKPQLFGGGREVIGKRKGGSTFPVQMSIGAMVVEGERLFVYMLTDLTELQRQRMELIAARDQIALATDVAELGVWSVDLATQTAQWSERMYAIYDLPQAIRDAGSGPAHWFQCLHPEDGPLARSSFEAALKTRSIHKTTYRIVTPKGQIRHIQVRAQASFDASGTPISVTGISRDITEQVELQANLTRALETSRAILDTTQNPIITIDVTGSIRTVNRASERDFGYTTAEIIGQNFRLLVPAPYQNQQDGNSDHSADQRTPQTFKNRREVIAKRKDGSEFPAQLSLGAMVIAGESLFVCMLTDLTEQQRQRKELEAARDQMLLAAEVGDLGVWTVDAKTQAVQWNDKMFEIYDLPLSLRDSGITFQRWRQCMHPDDATGTGTELQKTLVNHRTKDIEAFRIITSTGAVRHIQARSHMTCDASGKPVSITGINRDITDQLELETSLRRAKELADAASAAKSAFLANMSHEIRTPMNAVLGMLQLVQRTGLDVRQRDYISKANFAAKSLLGLLNDILDYSKIEAGKLELDPHNFELETLMRDLAIVLSGNQAQKDVEVIFDIAPTLPAMLIGDSLRLQQILINLAGNALKFTAHGHVEVSITERDRSSDRIDLRIAVTDTGIGIHPEQQERIFEGFTQAEASTTRRFGGTGLGLVISQRLVTLMGGTLQLDSALGKGSRFWFDLTLRMAPQTLALKSTYPLADTAIRVLVVDDNPIAGKVLVRTMEALGWQACYVGDGQQAVQRVAAAAQDREPYDVVFMDWRLPDQDGVLTARQIRDHAACAGRPPAIIMITAYGREELAETHPDSNPPFADFLTKPVTPLQLAVVVQHVLHGASMVANSERMAEQMMERPPQLNGLRVLVVEDNAMNRQIAAELLTGEGAKVQLAEGGLDGVAQVLSGQQTFDIVIMDIQMPDIDGLEATRRIRTDTRFRELPILAMTANVSQSDREQCLAAGMNEHIGKPIDLDELVLTLLTLQHGHTDAPAPQIIAKTDHTPADATTEELASILRRFGGKLELFRTMLAQFKIEAAHMLDALNQQIAAANWTAATATLHALKGNAGTMGAKALAQRAAELERTLKAADTVEKSNSISAPIIAAMQQLLTLCITQLEAAIAAADTRAAGVAAKPTANSDAKTIAPAQWRAKLAEILPLLQSNNLHALDLVEALATIAPRDQQAQLEQLSAQAQALDFEAAVLSVQTLLEKA